TATGAITLHGTGGAGTDGNLGVFLTGSGTAVRSAYGDISITGVGGDGGSDNYGILAQQGAVVESTGTGANAAMVTLHGTGGAGTGGNLGVFLTGSGTAVRSAYGDISITGVGGVGGSDNYGILAQQGAVVESPGTGANAAVVTLHGTGGAGTTFNLGVFLS